MSALSITSTAVIAAAGSGIATLRVAAAITVTAGQAVYNVGDGTCNLCDSNAGSPGDAARTFYGIATSGGSAGQTIAICTGTNSSGFTNGASGMTVGGAIYLMDTAGAITQTLADATGGTSVIIGTALSATTQSIIANGITGGTVA